jgi:hypothetical protein
MPTITAGRTADADEIRSYADIVAAHRTLCRQLDKGRVYADAAQRVRRLGHLYKLAGTITNDLRTVAETALAATREALRTHRDDADPFAVADTWLDQLSLIVDAPIDSR